MLTPTDSQNPDSSQREAERLSALDEYRVLDTPADPDLDRIVELAARICGAPIAALSLVGKDRLYLKSRYGVDVRELKREGTFCSYAIEGDDVFCVRDARLDPRFASLPIVAEPPHVRFYAGVPLRAPSGHKIGTVCILDVKPWPEFGAEDRKALDDVAALIMNRLEIQRVHEASLRGNPHFERIASTSPDAIVCASAQGRIVFWNCAAEALLGYTAEEALGKPIALLFPRRLRRAQTAQLAAMAQGNEIGAMTPRARFTVQRKDGPELLLEMALSVSRENDAGFGAILRDATCAPKDEERLFERAELDPLTGLANRPRLLAALRKEAAEGKGALFQIDLAGFKDVNDSLGHSAGDLLLRAAGERLCALVGARGKVARLGADEFGVLLPDTSEAAAAQLAAELIDVFDAPFVVGEEAVHLGVNIGVSMFPAHGIDAEALAANANIALERAKAAGRKGFALFTPRMRQVVVARRTVESELRRALALSQFELHYQPQVRLADRAVIGAEALLRWRHPVRGMLSPAAFLAVLEAGPLAPAVGDWVLSSAAAQAAVWREAHPDFRMAVNLFGAQFADGNLTKRVEAVLTANDLPAQALELEVTENIMLRGEDTIVAPLREMRDWGVGIAFDDYGTGFASLSLLKRFPVTRLKIDRSFVRDLSTDEEDAAIVKAIVYLGRCFQLGITAEGIESEAQAEALRLYGCREGQGYLYAEPLPAEMLARLLGQDRRRTVA
jgi:diguanylate cyclase (GGDEF)-like protein/PAS domain S-box-containing protein